MTRRAKLVATLGPATDGLERQLVATGLDVARLNFSHGVAADHARRCAAVRQAALALGRSVAVIQDLQGPKIRVGRLVEGQPVNLVVGNTLTITVDEVLGTAERFSCTYSGLSRDVKIGDRLLLDDGRIRLRVIGVTGGEVEARVEEGGPLGEHKGINLPGVTVSAPALTEKDREDLRFGLEVLDVDYVALSFVRSAAEVVDARALVQQYGKRTPLIVKLEKGEAIEELDAILDVTDGVMVARGDLGVELAPERVPVLQKRIIRAANARGIPVITATQMLETMILEEIPTRAEAADVANAVWDGTDALMLSAETASGRHPLLALEMMDRIVREAESAELPGQVTRGAIEQALDPAAAVTHAARVLAQDIGAAAIASVTVTGRTAELLSTARAPTPVYAFSADERVCQKLALWWGVTPIHRPIEVGEELAESTMERVLFERALLRTGDVLVATGVYPYQPGQPANFVKYQRVGGNRA